MMTVLAIAFITVCVIGTLVIGVRSIRKDGWHRG